MNRNRRIVLATLCTAIALLVSSPSSATIAGVPSAVDGFYTDDDGYLHTIAANTSGVVEEFYFAPPTYSGSTLSVSAAPLHTYGVGTIQGVTGYFTPADGYRHAVVAVLNAKLARVEIREIYYGAPGLNEHLLFSLATSSYGAVKGIDGFVRDDGSEHIVVATTTGWVADYRFGPGVPTPTLFGIAQFAANSVIDVTAYEASDGFSHAIVGLHGGSSDSLTEIYYTGTTAYQDPLLGSSFANIIGIGGLNTSGLGTTYINTIKVGYSVTGLVDYEYGNGGHATTLYSNSAVALRAVGAMKGHGTSARDWVYATTGNEIVYLSTFSTFPASEYAFHVAYF